MLREGGAFGMAVAHAAHQIVYRSGVNFAVTSKGNKLYCLTRQKDSFKRAAVTLSCNGP
jgi:hypothetical protein